MTTDIEDATCVILIGKRDAQGNAWCRTCNQYVRALPRSPRAQFEGEQPRILCPHNTGS